MDASLPCSVRDSELTVFFVIFVVSLWTALATGLRRERHPQGIHNEVAILPSFSRYSSCAASHPAQYHSGHDRADEGVARLKGRMMRSSGLDMMVVSQSAALMPWMTVYQNVSFAVQEAYPQVSQQDS